MNSPHRTPSTTKASTFTLLLAGLLCGLLLAPTLHARAAEGEDGTTEEAEADGAPDGESALPANAMLHLQTAPVSTMTQQIEAVAMAAVKGTPWEVQIQPGMIGPQIFSMLNLPESLFAKDRGLHVVVGYFANAAAGPQQFPVALVLPIDDLKARMEELQGMGRPVTEKEGAYHVGDDFAPMIFAPFGEGWAIFSRNADTVARAKALLLGWTPPAPLTGTPAPTVRVRIEAARASAALKAKAPELKTLALGGMAMTLSPDTHKKMVPLMDSAFILLEQMVALGEQANYTQHDLFVSGEAVRIRSILAPRAGTRLESFGKDLATVKTEGELMPYLPATPAMVATADYGDDKLLPYLKDYARVLEATMKPLDPEGSKAVADQIRAMAEMSAGEMAQAQFLDADETGQQVVSIFAVKDPEAWLGASEKLAEAFAQHGTNLLQHFGINTPITAVSEANAGEVEGTTLRQYGLAMDFEALMAEAVIQQEGAQAMEALKALKAVEPLLRYTFAVEGETLIAAAGTQQTDSAGETLKAVKSKTKRFPGETPLAGSFAPYKGKAFFWQGILFLETYRMQFAMTDPEEPVNEMIQQGLRSVGPSTACVDLFYGAQADGVLEAEAVMPAGSINDYARFIMAVMNAAMGGMPGGPGGMDGLPADSMDGF